MSGTSKSGKKRVPTATLKLTGQYREDRHGKRGDESVVSGKPRRPQRLKGAAATAWKHVVDATPDGIYGEQDTELLTAYAELWGAYCELWKEGEVSRALRVLERWLRIASDLGVGPISRCKLTIEKADDKEEALGDFLNSRRVS